MPSGLQDRSTAAGGERGGAERSGAERGGTASNPISKSEPTWEDNSFEGTTTFLDAPPGFGPPAFIAAAYKRASGGEATPEAGAGKLVGAAAGGASESGEKVHPGKVCAAEEGGAQMRIEMQGGAGGEAGAGMGGAMGAGAGGEGYAVGMGAEECDAWCLLDEALGATSGPFPFSHVGKTTVSTSKPNFASRLPLRHSTQPGSLLRLAPLLPPPPHGLLPTPCTLHAASFSLSPHTTFPAPLLQALSSGQWREVSLSLNRPPSAHSQQPPLPLSHLPQAHPPLPLPPSYLPRSTSILRHSSPSFIPSIRLVSWANAAHRLSFRSALQTEAAALAAEGLDSEPTHAAPPEVRHVARQSVQWIVL
ncbi:unnamed protein product [Closterium sp. NIES-53]